MQGSVREGDEMKVWLVGCGDCESNYVVCLCNTKELAVKKLFEKRDELVKEWKRMDKSQQKSIKDFCSKKKIKLYVDNMYKDMIKNLSSNDYENWNNYPQECPYICEMEVLD